MSQLIRFLVLSLVCLLAGCASLRHDPYAAAVLMPLPPAEGPSPQLLKQTATFESRGKSLSFIVVSRFDQQQVKLLALMPTGQTMTTIVYDDTGLTQKDVIPVKLPGKSILATFQFALWPVASLRQHYTAERHWSLSTAANRRQLWHDGTLILDIDTDQQTTRIHNYAGKYQVTIHTLEQMDLRK
ncbi:DUF3261 domain-containing protein [Pokkaliibacter sp. CJK22405]|uniref:DUF3261 domain-containing protein n=1 Tax=Pokkaliibacter sp. CJK22405 TaxID=3384615 RepID=UPI00398486FE